MFRYILRRLLLMVPMVLVALTVTFVMVQMAPGSPLSSQRRLPPEIEANLKAKYGFDQPQSVQYTRYMARLVGLRYVAQRGYQWQGYPDLGDSTSVVSAYKQNSWIDHSANGIAMLGITVPNFVLGPVLVLIFSLTLYWLPPARLEWTYEWGYLRIPTLRTVLLPALTLSALYVAYIARLTRTGLVETLKQEYIRTARAKGLSEWRVVTVHALRGAILPVVSFSGPALAFLLTGTVVVERMFAIPGLGAYFIDAANNRDHFLILGLTAFGAIALMFANLAVDVTYALIDPRIRYE